MVGPGERVNARPPGGAAAMDRNESSPENKDEPRLNRVSVETPGYYYVDRGEGGPGPAPMLIGLHGYAQTGRDFLKVTRRLASPEHAVATIQGLNQFWYGGNGQVAFAWMSSFEKEDNIERNNRLIGAVIDRLVGEGIAEADGIFVMGFSQGSAVALRFGQRHPGLVRGIITACSDLPPDVEAEAHPLPGVPVLVLYGRKDKWVPVEKPEHIARALAERGVDVETHAHNRGHALPSLLAEPVKDWMKRKLKKRDSRAAETGTG